QAKTSLSTFLLRWTVGLYLSLAMSNQLNLIECCNDLEELKFFVLSETWKTNPKIRNAIMAQYNRLDPSHTQNFGTPEFWNAELEESDEEMVPDGYEVIDEWHEDDDMVPEGYEVIDEWNEGDDDTWMLEKDYKQSGGQAQLAEEPIPDMNELYEMVPYSHTEYKRYYSGRMSCGIQFKDTSLMNDFYNLVPKVWDDILEKLSGHLDPEDKIGLMIDHPCLTDPIPFYLTQKKSLNGHK
ncbi:MAG: hypothetical protein GY795_01195, partial [Desulfobacterales bacterium]|nr:hypothetical protein [Desulfobacterales bacterium]